MRVTVHLNKYYDWVPVPAGTTLTDAELKSDRVKPSGSGGYLMRVPKEGSTHTTVMLPEEQIIAKIIDDKTRPSGGRTLTRKQAVAMYLSEHVMPHHAHRSWITGVEVHDDQGPDTAMLTTALATHVAAGNIEASDVDAHVAAYTEAASADAHVEHLHKHFKVSAPAATEKAGA